MLTRARRALQKPPAYVARRAIDDLRREVHRMVLAQARHGRGPLSEDRVIRDVNRGLELTACRTDALGSWKAAAEHFRRDEPAGKRLDGRVGDAKRREIELLGSSRNRLGVPLHWNDDAATGYRWPIRYHGGINFMNVEGPSDVKFVWELSRLRHCVALAQAVAVYGDELALCELRRDLLDWHRQNPVGWSVNWTSGMEVALRAVNLICVDGLLLRLTEVVACGRR